MKLHLVIVMLFLSWALSASAFTLGALTLSKDCTGKPSEFKTSSADGVYTLPVALKVEKTSGGLVRRTCNATLPVKLEGGEKLVIENVSQEVKMNIEASGSAKAQLEVFLAGQKSDILKAEAKATDKPVTITHKLEKSGVVAESTCGGEVIIRANASGVAIGSANISLGHEDLKVTLKAVKCAK